MVPKEYIKELVMLQDNVPGFPFEAARRIVEEDLGRPIEDLYDSFSPVPLAAASLGQVSAFESPGDGARKLYRRRSDACIRVTPAQNSTLLRIRRCS